MTRPEGSDAVGTAQPVVTFSGMDHAALARRTRRWGWVQYARYRQAAEKPFFWTAFVTALGNPVLYLVAMGMGLGSIVDTDVDGVSYLWFVAPGLLVATVVSTGAPARSGIVSSRDMPPRACGVLPPDPMPASRRDDPLRALASERTISANRSNR